MNSNPFANPYPVKQPTFLFGREAFMRRLITRLLGAQYQVSQQIVGLTRTGKTSILNCVALLGNRQYRDYMLHHFAVSPQALVDLDRVLFAYVDCTGMSVNTGQAFWTLVGRQIRSSVELQKAELLSFVVSKPHQDFDDVYWTLRHLSQRMIRVVILFDEFDRVLASMPSEVLDNLRFLLDDLNGGVVYMTATRRKWDSYDDRTKRPVTSSPRVYFDRPDRLSQKFPGYLGLLEPEGAVGFIRSIAELQSVHFTDEDIEFALRIGGRHPDLTRLVCGYLFETRPGRPTGAIDYQRISNKVQSDFEGLFENFWPELDTHLKDDLQCLVTGSAGDLTEGDLAELAALGLIVQDGEQFSLFSPIFEQCLVSRARGSILVRVVAKRDRGRAGTNFPLPQIFMLRQRRFQLALYVPLTILVATLTFASIRLVLGDARFSTLTQANGLLGAAILITAEFAVVGVLMWRLLTLLEHRIERRLRLDLPMKEHEMHMSARSEDLGGRQRSLILELIMASLAGVISSLVAALILHLL